MKRSASQETCLNNSPKRIKTNDSDEYENLEEEIQHVLYLDDGFCAPPAFVQKMAVKRVNAAQDLEIVTQYFYSLKYLFDDNVFIDETKLRQELFESGIDLIKERYQLGKLMFLRFIEKKTDSDFSLDNFTKVASILMLWESKTFTTAMSLQFLKSFKHVQPVFRHIEYIDDIDLKLFRANLRVLTSSELTNNKNFLKSLASTDGVIAYSYASYEMKVNREFVIEAVLNKPDLIKENEIQGLFAGDKQFVLELATRYESIAALDFASTRLKNDKELALVAVSINGLALELVSDDLINDKEVVMKAISNNPMAFEFASENLRADREVVMKAVSENPFALKHSRIFDSEIILIAAWQNIGVLEFVPKKFLQRRDFALELFEIDSEIAQDYVPEKFRRDKKFLMEIAKFDGVAALQFASEKMILDRELVIAAVSNNGSALEYAPNKFKKDEEIVKIADDNAMADSDESDAEEEFEMSDEESTEEIDQYPDDDYFDDLLISSPYDLF